MKVIKNNNGGFTLIELLAAIVMSGIVVGFAGWALVQMLQIENKVSESTDAAMELNRAADYITEDIRSSNKVECHEDPLPEVCNTDYSFPAGLTPVIALNVPEDDGSEKEIIYYYYQLESDQPEDEQPELNSIWRGPLVLYRRENNDPPNVLIDALDSIESKPCELSEEANQTEEAIEKARKICAIVELKRKDKSDKYQDKYQTVTAKAVTRAVKPEDEP